MIGNQRGAGYAPHWLTILYLRRACGLIILLTLSVPVWRTECIVKTKPLVETATRRKRKPSVPLEEENFCAKGKTQGNFTTATAIVTSLLYLGQWVMKFVMNESVGCFSFPFNNQRRRLLLDLICYKMKCFRLFPTQEFVKDSYPLFRVLVPVPERCCKVSFGLSCLWRKYGKVAQLPLRRYTLFPDLFRLWHFLFELRLHRSTVWLPQRFYCRRHQQTSTHRLEHRY